MGDEDPRWRQGEASRAVGAHRLNAASSRSHALLRVLVDMPTGPDHSPTVAQVRPFYVSSGRFCAARCPPWCCQP